MHNFSARHKLHVLLPLWNTYHNHKASFKHKKHSTMTALSKYTWELKEKQQEYKLTLLS